jgi:hypothetical protein
MKHMGPLWLAVMLAVSCGGDEPRPEARHVALDRVLAAPWEFDGERVEFRATYVRWPEGAALADGLAESFPPQPSEPWIWVGAPPPEGDCLVEDLGIAWGGVVANGEFRYEEGGAFGPLGVLSMELASARLSCA